jgi:hypothetical protein
MPLYQKNALTPKNIALTQNFLPRRKKRSYQKFSAKNKNTLLPKFFSV